jgi:hypothetical protein
MGKLHGYIKRLDPQRVYIAKRREQEVYQTIFRKKLARQVKVGEVETNEQTSEAILDAGKRLL